MTISRRSRQGSALVITILIITIITTLSFTATGLALSEFRKVAVLQDSISAYYTAEAGIEHGLMQQRLWKNAELSKEYYAALQSPSADPQSVGDLDTPQMYLLSGLNRFVLGNALPADNPLWYGLKMRYKNDHIGSLTSSKQPVIGPASPRLFRDSAMQLAVPKGARRVAIAWEPTGGNTTIRPGLDFSYFLEITITYKKIGTEALQVDHQIISSSQLLSTGSPNDITLPDGTESIRIKPWDMDSVLLSLVMYDANSQPLLFDRQVTTINATGTVGQAKRTIDVSINRSSQNLLEASDFLLLTGDSPIIINGD